MVRKSESAMAESRFSISSGISMYAMADSFLARGLFDVGRFHVGPVGGLRGCRLPQGPRKRLRALRLRRWQFRDGFGLLGLATLLRDHGFGHIRVGLVEVAVLVTLSAHFVDRLGEDRGHALDGAFDGAAKATRVALDFGDEDHLPLALRPGHLERLV